MATRRAAALSGIVKRIVRDKGFGFVRDASGTEYFFHRSGIEGDWESLQEGDEVTFEEDENATKGPRAKSLQRA